MPIHSQLKKEVRRYAAALTVCSALADVVIATGCLLVTSLQAGGEVVIFQAVGKRLALSEAAVETGQPGNGTAGFAVC